MNKKKIIYSLSVEDVFTVIEDSNWNIKIKKENISFIEEKVGDMIDWRGAIESVLQELKNSREKLQTK